VSRVDRALLILDSLWRNEGILDGVEMGGGVDDVDGGIPLSAHQLDLLACKLGIA
jgi:hypothetical protein